MISTEKYKINNYFKEIKPKLDYFYRGHEYSAIIICIVIVLLSRLSMYLVYKLGYDFLNINNSFIHTINIWDSGWYNGIIENGYNLFPSGHVKGDAANWAFFPLYPFIIRGLHYIFPVDIFLLGTIVSNIFFIAALVISYIYIIETRNNQKQALYFVLIMSFGLNSFYFSILYTEALYIFLLVLALYLLHKEKYILVGVVGAFLSATRNLGVMIVFAVLIQYTTSYLNNEHKSFKNYFVCALKDTNLVLGILLIPVGLFSYMTYLWKLIGDPMAFAHIQIAWGKPVSNPFTQLIKAMLSKQIDLIYLGTWVIFAIICALYLLIEKRFTEGILAFIFIIIPLSTGVGSTPRFIMGSFVFILALTDIVGKINKQWLYILIMFMSSIGEVFLLIKWFEQAAFLC